MCVYEDVLIFTFFCAMYLSDYHSNILRNRSTVSFIGVWGQQIWKKGVNIQWRLMHKCKRAFYCISTIYSNRPIFWFIRCYHNRELSNYWRILCISENRQWKCHHAAIWLFLTISKESDTNQRKKNMTQFYTFLHFNSIL